MSMVTAVVLAVVCCFVFFVLLFGAGWLLWLKRQNQKELLGKLDALTAQVQAFSAATAQISKLPEALKAMASAWEGQREAISAFSLDVEKLHQDLFSGQKERTSDALIDQSDTDRSIIFETTKKMLQGMGKDEAEAAAQEEAETLIQGSSGMNDLTLG